LCGPPVAVRLKVHDAPVLLGDQSLQPFKLFFKNRGVSPCLTFGSVRFLVVS